VGPEINTGGGSALAYPSACHSLDWRGGLRLRHRGLARPHIQTRGQERLPVPVVFGRSENAAAATATPFDSFSSQKELAELAAQWPADRLVAIWNSLPGVTPVKKFKDHKTAISRVWKRIQGLS